MYQFSASTSLLEVGFEVANVKKEKCMNVFSPRPCATPSTPRNTDSHIFSLSDKGTCQTEGVSTPRVPLHMDPVYETPWPRTPRHRSQEVGVKDPSAFLRSDCPPNRQR